MLQKVKALFEVIHLKILHCIEKVCDWVISDDDWNKKV